MDLNLRMQSILVKQHVLEALNTHEVTKQQDDDESYYHFQHQFINYSEEESSEEDDDDESDASNESLERQKDPRKASELQFESPQNDMDFGGSSE